MAPEVVVEAGGALLGGVEARQHLGVDLQLVVVVLLLLPRLCLATDPNPAAPGGDEDPTPPPAPLPAAAAWLPQLSATSSTAIQYSLSSLHRGGASSSSRWEGALHLRSAR